MNATIEENFLKNEKNKTAIWFVNLKKRQFITEGMLLNPVEILFSQEKRDLKIL